MKIAKEKEYVLLNNRGNNFLAAILIVLVGMMLGGASYVGHQNVIDPTFSFWAKGPCFFSATDRNQAEYDNPDNYSGYSVIVDTLWNKMIKKQEPKEKKPQTMMVNGKEYILQ